jgi:hypothetical protein
MKKISWIGHVRNEGSVTYRVKGERNILHTIKRRKANWICYMLHRNCLLKHIIEGKKEGRKDRSDGRTRKKTLSNYWLNFEYKRILKIERGSIRSHSMENSPWKNL